MEIPIRNLEEYEQRLGQLDVQKAVKDIATCESYLSELRHGLTYLRHCQAQLDTRKREVPLADYRDLQKRLKRWRQALKVARYQLLQIQEMNLILMGETGGKV